MNKLLTKYANVILNTCLKVEKNQPLFISANIERIDFVRILAQEAYKIGIKDIYFEITDPELKHDALANLELKDLKKMPFWNKEKWNEYAKKDSAFIMLASETPGLMKDIDPKLLSDLTIHALNTRKEFDDLRDQAKISWCIAAVPTEEWAKQVFPKSKKPVEDMWNKIFEICNITNKNPEKILQEKIDRLSKKSEELTKYQFKKLIYTNSLGTNFSIELPKNHKWCSGMSELTNGKNVLVNFPTEEIFTSPTYDSASGIVYSSKPLAYQDNLIDEFWIKFEKGKVIDYGAKKGKKVLKNIIESCKNSDRLGEVALVEHNSPISNSNLIFYETLYDENAACHLALGASFPECIENGEKLTKEELKEFKLNDCRNHVDFMIGTEDLNVIGITEDNKEIIILENGNFK